MRSLHVNWTKILLHALILFCQKNTKKQTISRGKVSETLLYEKAAHKMLVTFTPWSMSPTFTVHEKTFALIFFFQKNYKARMS